MAKNSKKSLLCTQTVVSLHRQNKTIGVSSIGIKL